MSELNCVDCLGRCIRASAIMTGDLTIIRDYLYTKQQPKSQNLSVAPENSHNSSNLSHPSSNSTPKNIPHLSNSMSPKPKHQSLNLSSSKRSRKPIDSLLLNTPVKRISKSLPNHSLPLNKTLNSTPDNSRDNKDSSLSNSNTESNHLSQSIAEIETSADFIKDLQHIAHNIERILTQYPWLNIEIDKMDQAHTIEYRFLKYFQYSIKNSHTLQLLYIDGTPRYLEPITVNSVMMNDIIRILAYNSYWMKPLIRRLGIIETQNPDYEMPGAEQTTESHAEDNSRSNHTEVGYVTVGDKSMGDHGKSLDQNSVNGSIDIAQRMDDILSYYPWIAAMIDDHNTFGEKQPLSVVFIDFFHYHISHSKMLHAIYTGEPWEYLSGPGNVKENDLALILSKNLYWIKPMIEDVIEDEDSSHTS